MSEWRKQDDSDTFAPNTEMERREREKEGEGHKETVTILLGAEGELRVFRAFLLHAQLN